jgi:hypothetical protein
MRRFFLMQEALAEAMASRFTAESPGWQAFLAARAIAESAAFIVGPGATLRHSDGRGPALVLLREALRWALVAHLARGGSDARAFTAAELFDGLLQGPRASALARVPKPVVEGARAAFVDPFCPDEPTDDASLALKLGNVRIVVDALLRALESEVERVARVRMMRFARLVGVPLLAVVLIVAAALAVRAKLRPPNLALKKPVAMSSQLAGHPPAPGAVDGYTAAMGFCTQEEQSPWLKIDLQAAQSVRRVKVYNRSDGWMDRAVPLVVEGSVDGTQFRELARRDRDFKVWEATFPPTVVRYVRVVVPRLTYLHLNEVELY